MTRFVSPSLASSLFPWLALALVSACGASSPYTREGGLASGAFATFDARAVEWNPSRAAVGAPAAIADAEDDVVVFSDGGATLFSGGAVLGADKNPLKWVGAVSMPAADGRGTWLVGVDDKGKLYRMRARVALEPVSDRYGLGAEHVRAAAALGGSRVAFLLDKEIAVTDGAHVTRLAAGAQAGSQAVADLAGARALAGGGGRVATLGAGVVTKIDPATHEVRTYPLEGVAFVALDGHGRVYAATAKALYVEDAQGALSLQYVSGSGGIHGLAASGADAVWIADGADLGVVEGARISFVRAAKLEGSTRLAGSSSGDVWVLGAAGVQRFGRQTVDAWTRDVRPVFSRACAACHMPGGSAGVDLSTREAWEENHDEILERVVVAKTMPPSGRPLSDADRDVLHGWLRTRTTPAAPAKK